MSNKKANQGNHANQLNPNKGSSGTNTTFDKVQGNRGTQLNPNQTGKGSSTKAKP